MTWKEKIILNLTSKKNWAFYLIVTTIICNAKFNLGIDSKSIEWIVYAAIGLFAGDGLAHIGEGLAKLGGKKDSQESNV